MRKEMNKDKEGEGSQTRARMIKEATGVLLMMPRGTRHRASAGRQKKASSASRQPHTRPRPKPAKMRSSE